jgi:hypothetical protein
MSVMRQLHQPINSSDDFVPALSLHRPWDYFLNRFQLSDPEHGADDLDDYEAVLLEIDGQRFLLLRYARYPRNMVDVFIPSALATFFAVSRQNSTRVGSAERCGHPSPLIARCQ